VVVIRAVPAAAIRPLRLEVLRPGRPPEDAVYPGDDDETSLHVAAFAGDAVVGIASLYKEERPDGPSPGWRLRGMATAPAWRGRGLGRDLLEAAVHHVRDAGGGELWCNARTPAVRFYERSGFEVISEPFDIAGIGPHVVMRRTVAGAPPA
jgi:GNAT superfamily N-acetyltransferase